ncbi:MAG: hypothetical protein KC475_04145 [Cyanobacteria bacterium HKST-UBA03]|nr:hypothetical protein [Cyanobacteria bacterium HKST-UBA03]
MTLSVNAVNAVNAMPMPPVAVSRQMASWDSWIRTPYQTPSQLTRPYEKATNAFMAQIDAPLRQRLALPDNAPMKVIKDNMFNDLQPAWVAPFVASLPIVLRQRYGQLRQYALWLNSVWKSAYDQIRPYCAQQSELIRRLLPAYHEEIKALRLDPDDPRIAVKHPKNVRVIASIDQNYKARTANPDRIMTPGYASFISRLQAQPTVDAAIDDYENNPIFIPSERAPYYPDNPDYPPIPHLEHAVSTPNRAQPNAWRKADNTNPLVRRVAILIATNDGSGAPEQELPFMVNMFRQMPAKDYELAGNNPRQYRVDKLVVIKPVTLDEQARGITQVHKIRAAYAQLNQFVEQQYRQALVEGVDPRYLQFEGFCSWTGHGTTPPPQTMPENDDRRYLQGAHEFYFITGPGDARRPEGLSETEIKQLEQQFVAPHFRYFVQHFNACKSGAAIA